MADIAAGIGLGIIVTFIPLYVGLFLPKLAVRVGSENKLLFLSAFASGIIFWFFLDVMGDAALLDINQGFGGNYTHIVLAGLFAAGLIFLLWLERISKNQLAIGATVCGRRKEEEGQGEIFPKAGFGFAVTLIVALGIGFHALGEGLDIGSIIPNSSSIVNAIGGPLPGIAYVLHKLLEGLVIGVFALLGTSTSLRQMGFLGLVGGLPTVVGLFIGLPSLVDSSYFFALGGAGAVYVEYKLIPLFAVGNYRYTASLFLLAGFYTMYSAGLFHG